MYHVHKWVHKRMAPSGRLRTDEHQFPVSVETDSPIHLRDAFSMLLSQACCNSDRWRWGGHSSLLACVSSSVNGAD